MSNDLYDFEAKALDALADADAAIEFSKPVCKFNVERLENAVSKALREAYAAGAAAERERCAMIAEEVMGCSVDSEAEMRVIKSIAKAIRSQP